MGRQRRHSVLVVAAAPDDRPSTATLRIIVDEMERRPELRVEVWFLRAKPEERLWPGARVVDALRTSPPMRALDAVGLGRVADHLRGLRLRWWNRRVDPDLVLLDDGFGQRVLTPTRRRPAVAVRPNDPPPERSGWEAVATDYDILVEPASSVAPQVRGERPLRIAGPVVRDGAAARAGRPDVRSATRAELGLPADRPLVVGWGDDGWIDGADAFVRALWALERHHGIVASGLWLGLQSDRRERERLVEEAQRCGVDGRFVVRPDGGQASRSCGDVVLLPYRSPADPDEVLDTIVSGVSVVTFLPCGVDDELVRVTRYLDVDGAASELASALSADREVVANAAAERLDAARLVDRLVAASRQVRR